MAKEPLFGRESAELPGSTATGIADRLSRWGQFSGKAMRGGFDSEAGLAAPQCLGGLQ